MPFSETNPNPITNVNIKVVGIGGGGNNAVNRMIATNIKGVEFIAINTDQMALIKSNATKKIAIGEKITRGQGAGANPDIGKRAAEESLDEIKNALSGADMVFLTAGMGGGTGTGAAPVIAKLAQELDILTVGIATKPFAFEGKTRMAKAEAGIDALRDYVDSLIIIPNERLKQVSETRITLLNAFEIADDVLRRGVQSVSELVNMTAYINLDFADVTAVMKNAGYAHMGVGDATGKDKAELAAKAAISSPLLETSIDGARGILVSIIASTDIGLEEIDLASTMITKEAHPDANIIWGVAFDPELEDEMKVTIIATGFEKNDNDRRKAPKPPVKAAAPTAARMLSIQKDEENEEEEADVASGESAFSDDEFDEIRNIMKKQKTPEAAPAAKKPAEPQDPSEMPGAGNGGFPFRGFRR